MYGIRHTGMLSFHIVLYSPVPFHQGQGPVPVLSGVGLYVEDADHNEIFLMQVSYTLTHSHMHTKYLTTHTVKQQDT